MTAKVTLTNAQVLALVTTPVEIIPAPGANKAAVIRSVTIKLKDYAADYTNIDPAAVIRIADPATFLSAVTFLKESANSAVSNLLAFGSDTIAIVNQYSPINSSESVGFFTGNATDFENKGMSIFLTNGGSGNLTGGDAAQSLVVIADYYIADLS